MRNSPEVAAQFPYLTAAGVEIKDRCMPCDTLKSLEMGARVTVLGGSNEVQAEVAGRVAAACLRGVVEPVLSQSDGLSNCGSRSLIQLIPRASVPTIRRSSYEDFE